MDYVKLKHGVRFFVLLVVATVLLGGSFVARASASDNGPELPEQCSSIAAPAGTKLAFHVYANGVQIYRWSGVSWDFVGPRAALFAEPRFFGEVGSHYAGPTWESKSGSKVKAARVPGTGCSPDAGSIAWLLLERVDSSGPGIFASVTFVQRVNTSGGMAPTSVGTSLGEIVEVPYTAEYYFYRAQ